jgi:hypothetical protein
VGDAFELIWPTGDVDEDVVGGLVSEAPPGGAHPTDTLAPSETTAASEPITVLLRPVTPPPEEVEPLATGPVPENVVLAVQRAIAALGSDAAVVTERTPLVDEPAPVVDEPAAASRLAERSTWSDVAASGKPASSEPAGDPPTNRAPSGSTEQRRSALKRLISGLRRR